LSPTTISPTANPTTIFPTTSPTTLSPTTISPSWKTIPPEKPSIFPFRAHLDDCPDDALVLAWDLTTLQVLASGEGIAPSNWIWGDGSTDITCYRLKKHLECVEFPDLCPRYEPGGFKDPDIFDANGDITVKNNYAFGSSGITIYRGIEGRVLVNCKSWQGEKWYLKADLVAKPGNLIWQDGESGTNSHYLTKFWQARYPAGCPPQMDDFAAALDQEIPLLTMGVSMDSCFEISGDALCFLGPVTAKDRAKLAAVCMEHPEHLFCDIIPKWFNKTYGPGPITATDVCRGQDLTVHADAGGRAVELRGSDKEYLYYYDPKKKIPFGLGGIIEYLGKLTVHEGKQDGPTPAPVKHGTPTPQPTMAPTFDIWPRCMPVRADLSTCPEDAPVALLNNSTRLEVVVCTSTAPPPSLLPRPIGFGSTCGRLRTFRECMEFPECPLSASVATFHESDLDDDGILKLSKYDLHPQGITVFPDANGKKYYNMFSRIWRSRSHNPYAGAWGPNLTLGGTEEFEYSGTLKAQKHGMLWVKFEPKLDVSSTTGHCRLDGLFDRVLPYPYEGYSPILQLPHSCVQGTIKCFPPPFDEKYRYDIIRKCRENPSNYWCDRVREWMGEVTRKPERKVKDECKGGGNIEIKYGSHTGVLWIEFRSAFEFLRASFRVLEVNPGFTAQPSRSPTKSESERPSLEPSRSPVERPLLSSNESYAPTATMSPSMAPGSIPVPFPPARNIKSLSARLANIARTIKLPDNHVPRYPFGFPFWLFVLFSVLSLLCCMGLTAGVTCAIISLIKRRMGSQPHRPRPRRLDDPSDRPRLCPSTCPKICTFCCRDPSRDGYAAADGEDDDMSQMMEQLEDLAELKDLNLEEDAVLAAAANAVDDNAAEAVLVQGVPIPAHTQEAIEMSEIHALEAKSDQIMSLTSHPHAGQMLPPVPLIEPSPDELEADGVNDVIQQLNATDDWERVPKMRSRHGNLPDVPL